MSIKLQKLPRDFDAFRDGSRHAFEYYYSLHIDRIYHYLMRLTGEADIAKDLCQKTFIDLWDSREKINDEGHLKGYLFAVAKNNFLQHLRKQRTTLHMEKELVYFKSREWALHFEAEMDCQEVLEKLYAALNRLPPRQQLVMTLYYKEGYDIGKIAKTMALRQQTVRNHVTQALTSLRKKVGRIMSYLI